MKDTKLGTALVGLGEYATDQLMPALSETEHCYLAALVSGSREKLQKWSNRYAIDTRNSYLYDQFDDIADNNEIDIVYIVLPNFMHAEYSIRAAKAGKHVICEKPMAMNVTQSLEIIQAVKASKVRFSMGYRLHFDPFNKEMMRLGEQNVYGDVKHMTLQNSKHVGASGQWRLDMQRAGGGPLMNNGVYCIQAALYIKGELPVAVEAGFLPVTDAEKFNEVEEGIEWTLYFADGSVAECETCYSKEQNLVRAEAENGWFELSPAYEYDGLQGHTPEGEMEITAINQQAAQMDDFALCIKDDKPTIVPAAMGLRDMEIMGAVYEAAVSGEKILLDFSSITMAVEND